MSAERHLAHFNWATLKAPVGSPDVAPFVNAIPKVNALAERSPGFVWRSGDEAELAAASGWPLFVENDRLIASFSVWETPEALCAYVDRTVHGAFFRRGAEWFEHDAPRGHVLWWIPSGYRPSITEARENAEALAAQGASDEAFTLAQVRRTDVA